MYQKMRRGSVAKVRGSLNQGKKNDAIRGLVTFARNKPAMSMSSFMCITLLVSQVL